MAVAAACLFAPATADAYRPGGDGFWRQRVVTFSDRTSGAYGGAARNAIAAWNTSGMRLVLAPAPPAHANIRIRGFRHGTHGVGCFGIAGTTASPGDGRGGLRSAEVRFYLGGVEMVQPKREIPLAPAAQDQALGLDDRVFSH